MAVCALTSWKLNTSLGWRMLVRFFLCRALYSACMQAPEQLATAQEEDVKRALAAGLPGAVKKTKQDKYDSQTLQLAMHGCVDQHKLDSC